MTEYKNGSPLSGGTSANGHTIEIVARETSYSVENNTSTVALTARLVYVSGGPGSYGSIGSWSLSRVGVPGAVNSGPASYNFQGQPIPSWKDQGSASITVEHNADGTGSVEVQANFSSSHLGHGEARVTVPLTTIPRASTSTFTGGSSFDAGSPVTVNTNRASTSFTHTIDWFFGTASGSVGTGVGASVSWTPPLSMLSQIPNATSGTGHIRTRTYSGGTLVGSKDTPFTLRAPASVKPTISSLTVSDNNPTVVSIVGLFVQNLSILKATVNAAGVYGSTIKTRTFKMGSTTVNSGGVIPVTVAGSVALSASATDSRGRTGAWSGTLPVLAYATPKFNSVLVRRSNASGTVTDSGTSLRVDLNAAVSSLMNGTQRNSMTVRVFTRPRGGSVWTARNVINHTSTSYNSNFVVSGGANYPIDDSFDVRVDVVDKFKTSSAQTVVATAAVFMHWSKTGVGVGKFHEQGALDIEGNVFMSGTLSSGSVPNARLTELSPGLNLSSAAAPAPSGDLNNATASGMYQSGPTTINRPPGDIYHQVLVINGGGRSTQIAYAMAETGRVYKRWREPSDGATFVPWVEIFDERATTPYKTAAGVVGTPSSGYATVTMPAGFTVLPRVIASGGEQGNVGVSRIINRTTTSFQINVWGLSGSQIAGTVVNWLAVQMTPTSASG